MSPTAISLTMPVSGIGAIVVGLVEVASRVALDVSVSVAALVGNTPMDGVVSPVPGRLEHPSKERNRKTVKILLVNLMACLDYRRYLPTASLIPKGAGVPAGIKKGKNNSFPLKSHYILSTGRY
jgi:hypothetical protein